MTLREWKEFFENLGLIEVKKLNGYAVFRISDKGLKVINNLQQLLRH